MGQWAYDVTLCNCYLEHADQREAIARMADDTALYMCITPGDPAVVRQAIRDADLRSLLRQLAGDLLGLERAAELRTSQGVEAALSAVSLAPLALCRDNDIPTGGTSGGCPRALAALLMGIMRLGCLKARNELRTL
jgi:hypothetical protein